MKCNADENADQEEEAIPMDYSIKTRKASDGGIKLLLERTKETEKETNLAKENAKTKNSRKRGLDCIPLAGNTEGNMDMDQVMDNTKGEKVKTIIFHR